MARLAEHEKDCVKKFGKPFTEVHIWLDEFAKKFPVTVFEDLHRKYRHTKQGVEEVRKMWGDEAAEAALLHIVKDVFGSVDDKYSTLWRTRDDEEE